MADENDNMGMAPQEPASDDAVTPDSDSGETAEMDGGEETTEE